MSNEILAFVVVLIFSLFVVYALLQAKRQPKDAGREVRGNNRLYLNYPASRIELVACVSAPGTDTGSLESWMPGLKALSFEDAGWYTFGRRSSVNLRAFVQQTTGVTLTFLLREGRPGNHFEMATHYGDGTSFAFSRSPFAAVISPPSHWTICSVSDVDPASLYANFLASRPRKPIDPDRVDDFAHRYEERYARIMDWRNLRGGYSDDEIRAMILDKGLTPTDEMVARTKQMHLSGILHGLEVALQEQFFQEAGLTDEQAEAIMYQLAIIHDRLSFDAVLAAFASGWRQPFGEQGLNPWQPAEAIRALRKPPREAFALLNERTPGPRFLLVAQLTKPLTADVYVSQDTPYPPGSHTGLSTR